jgi:protein gp37
LGDKTSIEWTDATWNWANGCTRISPGCENCYMYRLYPRLHRMKNRRYPATADIVTVHEDLLNLPLRWLKPRMIFTCSMSDFFHEKIPDQIRNRAVETIRKTRQHTYQILTKRSWVMKRYSDRIGGFPDNVWLGVSVEDSRFKFRIDHLRKSAASVRFLSVEPLIGPVGRLDLQGIQWVIVGGESGPNHRPLNVEWAREVRDQCLAAGVSFFFKQWGGTKPTSGGRCLDGEEWTQFPRRLEVQSHSLPFTEEASLPVSETIEIRTPH